ncbi:unnamed protein product [Ambrosiozyma monospora]|uniref:Unnamed protein product n=1 Tax=Ambrosiozyma monospora TaxID=43982 RepID=A0ACB5STV3_AMBMO|nr:unnamed protein product [Ambrosiozyma monospora]
MISNEIMCETYTAYMKDVFKYDIPPLEDEKRAGPIASTDQGNVSYVVPAIQPTFGIISDVSPHNPGFAAGAGTETSHKAAVETGMGLAFTGLEILGDSDLLPKIKTAWKKDVEGRHS